MAKKSEKLTWMNKATHEVILSICKAKDVDVADVDRELSGNQGND